VCTWQRRVQCRRRPELTQPAGMHVSPQPVASNVTTGFSLVKPVQFSSTKTAKSKLSKPVGFDENRSCCSIIHQVFPHLDNTQFTTYKTAYRQPEYHVFWYPNKTEPVAGSIPGQKHGFRYTLPVTVIHEFYGESEDKYTLPGLARQTMNEVKQNK
jgi:hypothetical protein